MSVMDEIQKINAEGKAKEDEASRLASLIACYPDLQKYTGRWGKVVYFSKAVNADAQMYDRRFNCGCCRDSPLEIWPFLETPFGPVYTDPPRFVVGEKDWIYGARPESGWKETMQREEIREEVVSAVEAYFSSCREERIRIASEDGS